MDTTLYWPKRHYLDDDTLTQKIESMVKSINFGEPFWLFQKIYSLKNVEMNKGRVYTRI
jgi:hypothetical protein